MWPGRIKPPSAVAVSLILLTWLIFFARILFGGQLYFLDDLKIIYSPLEYLYSQFQSSFTLPVWSPYFGFGQPLIAWGQLGFFTPLHILLRLLPIHEVLLLNISTLTYSAAGLAGMYAFLRQRKLSPLPAALGAIVFGFCGFTIGHLNHVNFYTATMLLPWLLLAVSTFINKPTLPRTAILAIIASAIPLSGQPQISLYTLIIGAIFGIWDLIGHWSLVIGHWKKITTLTLLSTLLFFLLSSFAILPLREFLPATDRAADLSVEELYEFSYPPSHVITLISPYYFGDHADYWGAKNFQELAAYVGFLPLALALLGLVVSRRHMSERIFGLSLVVIALIFAPGKYSPIYSYFVDNHILSNLTIPGRFVYFFDVGVALLAAVGLEQIIHRRERSHTDSERPGARVGRQNLVWLKASVGVTIVAATAANLIWWGWDYNPLTPAAEALKSSPFTETLRAYERETGLPARLYAAETLPLAGPFGKRDPRYNFEPDTDLERDLLLRHIHATAQVSSARWIGSLSIASYRTFIEQFFANDREPFDGEGQHAFSRFRNLVNASGITHITQALPASLAETDPVLASGYAFVQESRVGDTLLRLYRNPEAFPKAYLVGTAIWEPAADSARHGLGQAGFDARKVVYINGETPPADGTIPNQSPPNPSAFPAIDLTDATVRITQYIPTRVEIAVTTPADAWLVLTDSFTPEWQTFIDGQATNEYIANTVFRAAQVPAGSHTVVFQYISPAIQQAKILTAIGLVASASFLASPVITHRLR